MVDKKRSRLLELQAGGYGKNNMFVMLFKHLRGIFGFRMRESRMVPYLHPERGFSHTRPLGGNLYYDYHNTFPNGAFATEENKQFVEHINCEGVGAQIGIIAIPSRARMRSVKISLNKPEPGLLFKLTTLNGTILPQDKVIVTTVRKVKDPDGGQCAYTLLQETLEEFNRNVTKSVATTSVTANVTDTATTTDLTTGKGSLTNADVNASANTTVENTFSPPTDVSPAPFDSWGSFVDDDVVAVEIEGISATGEYVKAPSDLLVLEVVSLPTAGDDKVNVVEGTFDLRVSASYEITEKPIFERCGYAGVSI